MPERQISRGCAKVSHNLYCAFEDLFKIVAETFENHIQDKSKYHQELLKRMDI